jgi:hypothetical protein
MGKSSCFPILFYYIKYIKGELDGVWCFIEKGEVDVDRTLEKRSGIRVTIE